jgi:hypothetical protein
VAGQVEMMLNMDLQRSEAAAEVDMLFRRDVLIAEHQHLTILQRRTDRREVSLGQRLTEIDPGDLRTQNLGQRANGQSHGNIL